MEIVSIVDDDNLLRRIPIGNPSYIKPDGSITSFAFTPDRNDNDGLSVNLERLTTYQATVLDPQRFGLLRVSARDVRAIDGLDCIHSPVEGNYAHSLITGDLTKSKQKKLRDAAERIPQELL